MKKPILLSITVVAISISLAAVLQTTKAKTPSDVTRTFVNLLADGKCEEALKYSTGKGYEMVSGSMQAGCEAYKTTIVDVKCETRSDSCRCVSTENRPEDPALVSVDGEEGSMMQMKFIFDLVKVKSQWKVHDYAKDLTEYEKTR